MRVGINSVLVVLSFAGTSVMAQVVTTEPAFPSEAAPIEITFHADRGNTGLQGFTGAVYAHTGVITDQSTNPGDWKYVVADWRDPSSPAALERIATDTYRLRIEDIRAFYDVPAGEVIEQIALAFWGVGGGEGKGDGDTDIFVDLFDAAVNVRFIEPDAPRVGPALVEAGMPIEVAAVASSQQAGLRSFQLFVDEALVAETDTDTLRHTFSPGTGLAIDLRIHATDSLEQSAEAHLSLLTYSQPSIAPIPSGARDGINTNLPANGDVTFVLHAPGKSFVHLIGDYTDWAPTPEGFMNQAEGDAGRFWITVSGLGFGIEHGFQYLVDGEIRIADPYSTKVLEPFDDPDIDAQTYPGLKAYPSDKTDFAISVVRLGASPYVWKTEEWERPKQHELLIYELLIRDFDRAHTFSATLERLDYLEELGVNAIELLPVNEFEGNSSWGYNPAFHLATDKYYGPAEDLKEFVDACHARGIAVILDVVLNHAFGRSPLVRLYNEGAFGPPTPDNPWLNPVAKHPFNVGYDFNHESEATQGFVDRVVAYWLEEFKVDGFRFDLSKGFTQVDSGSNVGAWSSYDASRVALLKRLADQVWEIDDSAYVILEHLSENREEKELAEYGTQFGRPGMMLWGKMTDPYNEATMGYHTGGKSDLSGGYFKTRDWSVPNLITYMESHDEQRMMFKNLMFANNRDGYDIRQLPVALDRQKMAGAFFFTVPGPKMLWQFGELGYEVDIDFNGRTGEKPIRWNYLDQNLRVKLQKTWAELMRLRRDEPVFRDPGTTVELEVGASVKRIRLAHDSMNVVIVGNFDVVEREVTPSFHESGTWYEFFGGTSHEIVDPEARLSLAPGAFLLFTSKPVDPAESGLVTVSIEEDGIRSSFHAEVFPNPIEGNGTLRIEMVDAGIVLAELFDVSGRVVRDLVSGSYRPGSHEVSFDPSGLAAGVYFVRVTAGGETVTLPVVR